MTLTVCSLDLFLSSDASICSKMALPPLGNSDHVVISVSISFPINSKQDALFHHIAYGYSCVDWDGLRDKLRDVPWDNIFGLLLLLVNFLSDFRLELMHISLIVSIRSNLTHLDFQQLLLLPYFIKINFFICTNRINLLNLKQNSDRPVIIAKGFLKLPNVGMLLKQKSPSLLRNVALGTLPTKVNLLHLLYSMAQKCCLLHFIKQNDLLKFFIITLILMTWLSLYLFFVLELI